MREAHRTNEEVVGVLSPRTERDYRQVVERWTRDGQPEPVKAGDFTLPVLGLYRTYRLDMRLAERLARLVQRDPESDEGFLRLRDADQHLTSRLREVLALSELATFREDFDRWIAL